MAKHETIKVKGLTQAEGRYSIQRGEVKELPKEVALDFINAGYAEAVKEQRNTQTTTAKPTGETRKR